MVYDLSDEETAILTSNSIEEHPSEKRSGLINDIISPDVTDKASMETRNSNSRIAVGLHPEIRKEIEQEKMCIRDRRMAMPSIKRDFAVGRPKPEQTLPGPR